MTSIAETIRAAQQHYASGDYAEAERLCRQVLQQEPRQPDAAFQLGLLAMEAGRPDAAMQLIAQAIEFGGPHPAYYNNLALAQEQAGHPGRAMQSLKQALALEPDYPEGHNNLGAMLQRQGRLDEAATHFRRAVEARPDFSLAVENLRRVEALLEERKPSADELARLESVIAQNASDPNARNRIGIALIRSGRPEEALPHFRAMVDLEPNNAAALVNLANLLKLLGREAEAAAAREEAVRLNPQMADVFRGVTPSSSSGAQSAPTVSTPLPAAAQELASRAGDLLQGKNYAEAIASYRRALEVAPERTDLWNNLGAAQMYAGLLVEAAESFTQAVNRDPRAADSLTNLGLLRLRQGYPSEAADLLQRALDLRPDSAEIAYSLANAWRRLGNRPRALDGYLRAAAIDPAHAAALGKAGLTLHEMGRAQQADRLFRRAFELDPNSADVLNNWGNVQQDLNNLDAALDCYRRAVEADPQFVPAYCSLGYLLNDAGRLDEARGYLEKALELQPDNLVRVMLSNALPTIYQSVDEVRQVRDRLEQNIEQLIADGVTIDTTGTIVPTLFYLAYQGYNDRDVHRQMARVYRAPETKPVRRQRRSGDRIRVGFLSKYFRDHTIGRLNLGLIENLSREQFEVVVIASPSDHDPLAEGFRQHADVFCPLPYEPNQARRAILDLQLDVLFFADVGMDPLTYTLSFSRMAPVQCLTWGHPTTTGSPVMDYFISSELLEVAEADEHYTEKLIRLPDLAVCYERPTLPTPARDRQSFGFSREAHLYACPQSLFKLHPQFDEILAAILRGDPRGELILLEGKHRDWGDAVRQRFSSTMSDVCDRVRFLPRLKRDDFLALNALADVLLDPIHFCGGNTSYEGLALGTPIVTMPSQFLRGRITHALYRKMGFFDCVVDSPAEYADLALRLANDRDFRQQTSERILAANSVLYGNLAGVRQLEEFFRAVVE